jgi:hypothetical protein
MKAIGVLMLAMGGLLLASLPLSQAATPGFGNLYYKGSIVRTVVPPAAFPNEGRDNFYAFPNGGAAGQLGVASVAPGATDYHGGHWKFFAVTFNRGVTPSLLTSEDAVLAALTRGDVTVTRVPANDFLCPIQP